MRRGPGSLGRRLESVRFALTRDRRALLKFLSAPFPDEVGPIERLELLRRMYRVTQNVRGYHAEQEMLEVACAILRRRRPHVVEAGCAYGSSTCKLSLFAARTGGRLTVLDSFRGIPVNDEVHRNLDGRTVRFRTGAFRGRLATVRRNVLSHGEASVCTFVKGDFADTAGGVPGPIDVLVLDVDLLRSTRDCLAGLYAKVVPGGDVFSQDGHLLAVVGLLKDPGFWRELGVPPPAIEGLGSRKFLHWKR